jgi:hypothetical protein
MSVASAGNTVPTTFMIQATNHAIELLGIEFSCTERQSTGVETASIGYPNQAPMAFGIRTTTSVKKA